MLVVHGRQCCIVADCDVAYLPLDMECSYMDCTEQLIGGDNHG